MDSNQNDGYDSLRLDGLMASQAPQTPARKDRSWFPYAMALGTIAAIILALLTMM
jgi:hypothetical protein